MDRLYNPQLQGMLVEDLNQRYSESYCVYMGRPQYIHGFVFNGDHTHIQHANIATGHVHPSMNTSRFDWVDLNVARPNAGWYVAQGKEASYPLHLSYPVKKQYKRGLCPRNTALFMPLNRPMNTGLLWHSILSDVRVEPSFITDAVLLEGRSFIPRRDRALLLSGGVWGFWFGTECVAEIRLADQRIVFFREGFEQELYEVSRSALLDAMKVEYARHTIPDGPDLAIKRFVAEKLEARDRPNYFCACEGDWEEILDALKGLFFHRIAGYQQRVFPRGYDIIATINFEDDMFDLAGTVPVKFQIVPEEVRAMKAVSNHVIGTTTIDVRDKQYHMSICASTFYPDDGGNDVVDEESEIYVYYSETGLF